jgi:NADH-quinone oxidoreductase subunit L
MLSSSRTLQPVDLIAMPDLLPYGPYIILMPLAGFLIIGIAGKLSARYIRDERVIGWLGSGVVGIAFLVASGIFAQMLLASSEERMHTITLFNWMTAGTFSVNVAYQFDQLSILMTLVVTGVGFLIHVYSIGYMHNDPGFRRFFAYMNLFIFMMLNLILADNFLLMFLGWEGVGLCSYLLIGFWYDRKFDTGGYRPGTATTADAAKKAFIVNRIGDFGFLIAMFMIFSAYGSLRFGDVFSRAEALTPVGDATVVWITLLLFWGATGKSAQIPLFVWLPDAMAGPTPVSALIHAATMVTAGVYMVARCSILYALAPVSMAVVATIGIATAVFAATIGLVQNDIKKVLAYSTISQLGYMFLAMGVGAFAAGIFHVMTHAFFKALLFLGAGSVIHALTGEQDIRKMGGLKAHMSTTYWTFLIAALAIAGIPPLSGFFSKDDILALAFAQGSPVFWLLGWLGAGLTAFYMFRLLSLTFEGQARWSHHLLHPHESPKVMTRPLVLLGVLTIIGGLVGIPASLGGSNAIKQWLNPIFEGAESKLGAEHHLSFTLEYALILLSVGIAVGGILLARHVYLQRPEIAVRLSTRFQRLYRTLWNKYYIDEIYEAIVIAPIEKISEYLLWRIVDTKIIDGLVNGTAGFVYWAAGHMRKIQSGVAQGYVIVFVAGIVFVLAMLIFR